MSFGLRGGPAEGNSMAAEYGIVANVVGDRIYREGARVWIRQIKGESAEVTGLSKGGRRIWRWTRTHRLRTVRPKWAPEGVRAELLEIFESRENAERWADGLEKYALELAERHARAIAEPRKQKIEVLSFVRVKTQPGIPDLIRAQLANGQTVVGAEHVIKKRFRFHAWRPRDP